VSGHNADLPPIGSSAISCRAMLGFRRRELEPIGADRRRRIKPSNEAIAQEKLPISDRRDRLRSRAARLR